MSARWPDADPERFVSVVGSFLAIHAEGGYDDSETLASIRNQYQELIGQLPDTTQGSK